MSQLPDYFALLRTLTGVGGVPTSAAAPLPPLLFDPAEIERKISELNTVKLWLDAQSTTITMTVQALELQRDAMTAIQSATPDAAIDRLKTELGDAAAMFDPAKWMAAVMPSSTMTAPTTATTATNATTSANTAPASDMRKPRANRAVKISTKTANAKPRKHKS